MPCDLSDMSAVDKFAEDVLKKYGCVDVIVNNAAILGPISYEGDAVKNPNMGQGPIDGGYAAASLPSTMLSTLPMYCSAQLASRPRFRPSHNILGSEISQSACASEFPQHASTIMHTDAQACTFYRFLTDVLTAAFLFAHSTQQRCRYWTRLRQITLTAHMTTIDCSVLA